MCAGARHCCRCCCLSMCKANEKDYSCNPDATAAESSSPCLSRTPGAGWGGRPGRVELFPPMAPSPTGKARVPLLLGPWRSRSSTGDVAGFKTLSDPVLAQQLSVNATLSIIHLYDCASTCIHLLTGATLIFWCVQLNENDFKVLVVTEDSSVVLNQLQVNEQGTYRCSLQDQNGTVFYRATFLLTGESSAPKYTHHLKKIVR